MDPVSTSDGRPYGPVRYKEIVKERYLITKNCNTSYADIGNISPLERQYILEFIEAEMKKQQELLEQQKQKQKRR